MCFISFNLPIYIPFVIVIVYAINWISRNLEICETVGMAGHGS